MYHLSHGQIKSFLRCGDGLTSFLGADGKLLTGLALAYGVVGIHADAVDGGRVKIHNVGLIVSGGNVSGGMLQLPSIW